MRIVLDLQGAQSESSRFRGIGRYSLALAKEIAREAGRHEVWLVLNGRFPDSIQPLRAEFANLVPPERVRIFELPGPVAEADPANSWRRHAAEMLREKFLADLCPDVVHVSTLFEGFGNDVVISIGRLDASLPTAVTLALKQSAGITVGSVSERLLGLANSVTSRPSLPLTRTL